MGSTGQQLAEIVASISYKDLPEAVVYKTKQVILDTIGCALGARVTDRARIDLELIAELGGNPQAVIIGGGRSSWALAAFGNAELFQTLDFDVIGPPSGPHIAPYVISPSLSLAERVKTSGKELITAVALALEVGCRFYKSVPGPTILTDEPPYYGENPLFSFGSVQVYGGVAGASNISRLNIKQTAHAFGIAGPHMPVPATASWHHMPRPTVMTKFNTLTGWIAQLATMACLLAERGFTGDTTFLDNEFGFQNVLGASYFKPEIVIGDLGKKWHTEEAWLKAYPCCLLHHAGIDLINKIILQNNLNPDDIEEIVVKGTPALLRIPWTRGFADEVSFADCSHNNAYISAVAAYHGRNPGPHWLMPDTYNDPKIRNLMKRVRAEIYPGGEKFVTTNIKAGLFANFSDAMVEITATGRRYTAGGKGSQYPAMEQTEETRKPLSDDEIKAKFRTNASYSSIRSDNVERIIDVVYSLEKFENATEMLRLLG